MTYKQLLTEAKNLNIQEQMQLANQLLQWVKIKINKEPQFMSEKGQRLPGLNGGSCIFTDDSDDPLPDEFWLGEL